MKNLDLFAILADFLVYPDPSWARRLALRATEIASSNRPVADQLKPFINHAQSRSLTEFQELFTRTFDLNPICSLEVGWHLFGEDYRRGRFLAFVRRLLLDNGIKESSELPDHLTHMLPLLSRLEETRARHMGRSYVGPALRKMVAALERESSPFLPVLQSIESVLVSCWGSIPDGLPADIPAEAYSEEAGKMPTLSGEVLP